MQPATMPLSHFRALMADVTRANRGRPGRKGLPSKRVIAPKPADDAIATLLFYKQGYKADGNRAVGFAAFDNDKKVRDFLGQFGLKMIAPIEDTPSYRRVRIKKTANFDIESLKTFRIEGHEDVLVITGRLLTAAEISALGKKAVALAPRKRTLRAAGIKVSDEGDSRTGGSSVETAEKALKNRKKALAEKGDAPLTSNEVDMAVRMYAAMNRPKTADEIVAARPKAIRTLLVQRAEARLAEATAAATERAAAASPTPTPAPEPAAEAPKRGGRKPAADTLTAAQIDRFLQLANGDVNAGVKAHLPPPAGLRKWSKAKVKEAAKADIAKVREVLGMMEQSHAADVARAKAGVAEEPAPRNAKERAEARAREAAEAAAAAPAPRGLFRPAAGATAAPATGRPMFVPRTAAAPPPADEDEDLDEDLDDFENEDEEEEEAEAAGGSVDEYVQNELTSVAKKLKIATSQTAAYKAMMEIVTAGATGGAAIMARAYALLDAHDTLFGGLKIKNLGDLMRDPTKMAAAKAIITKRVEQAEAVVAGTKRVEPSAEEMRGRSGMMSFRRGTVKRGAWESDEGTRENSGLRTRRPATLRAPRANKRFAKVEAAQYKVELHNATLAQIGRDLGVVRRRLAALKGKRVAQAKYARDQLKAEETRLVRRQEKVTAQRDRAKATVARAVKAANPKKTTKAKPLPQRLTPRGKTTKPKKPTRRRR